MSSEKSSKIVPLEPYIQKYADIYADTVSSLEEENYHSDLVPFSQKKEQINKDIRKKFAENQYKLQHAHTLLRAAFAAQKNPQVSFSVWEEAAKNLKDALDNHTYFEMPLQKRLEAIQVKCNLPQEFMQFAYETAKSLLNEKHAFDAECIYLFLRYLNPNVFDYLLGVAIAEQEQENFAQALINYVSALAFNTHKDVVFFQMACCLFRLHEKESSLQCLDLCIEYAKMNDGNKELLQLAYDTKKNIEQIA